MDPTEAYAAAVTDDQVRLDRAALLLAAHARPDLDLDRELARLDAIAGRCPPGDLDGLCAVLFGELGLRGNRRDYDDPRNSFLPDVLERRLGIPISLAVVMMAIGRRAGVELDGVGMPGHFLVRSVAGGEVFLDPFDCGRRLDRHGCARAYAAVAGDDAPFDPAWLRPVGSHAILLRMLANLRRGAMRRGDLVSAAWVLRLRTLTPGAPPSDRAELASVLAAMGRFPEAAAELERAAATGAAPAEDYERAAARLRARMN